jgi:hypothetical protein
MRFRIVRDGNDYYQIQKYFQALDSWDPYDDKYPNLESANRAFDNLKRQRTLEVIREEDI